MLILAVLNNNCRVGIFPEKSCAFFFNLRANLIDCSNPSSKSQNVWIMYTSYIGAGCDLTEQ